MLLCRLCLKTNTVLQNIITSEKKCADLTLVEFIYWVFGVEVDVNDLYSQLICNRCENVVQYISSYRILFQKNQLILNGTYDSEGEAEWINEVMVGSRKLSDNKALHISGRDDLSAKARIRRWEFIDYYYRMPTTAIQDLIRTKEHKTDSLKSDTKSLFELKEAVKVEVCKYCSKIFRLKCQLIRHYTTKHKSLKMLKLKLGRKKCKTTVAKEELKEKLTSNLFDATKFPNLNYMKQLDLFTSSQKATNAEENLDFSIKNKSSETSSIVEAVDCRTNLTSQLEEEKQNSQGVADQLEKKIEELYKHPDLKDFCISVQKCAVPEEFEENDELPVDIKPLEMFKMKEYISSTLLKLKNIQSIKDKFERLKPAVSDPRQNVANQNVTNGTNLVDSSAVSTAHKVKDNFKELNHTDLTVSLQEHAVPPQFHENSFKRNRKAKKKRRNIFLMKRNINQPIQRKYNSKAVGRLQRFSVSKTVGSPGKEKNPTFNDAVTVPGTLESGKHLVGDRGIPVQSNAAKEIKRKSTFKNQHKEFNAKNVYRSVKKCTLPLTFYPNEKTVRVTEEMDEAPETFPFGSGISSSTSHQWKGHPYETVHMRGMMGENVSKNECSTAAAPNENKQIVKAAINNVKNRKRRRDKSLCPVKNKVKRTSSSIALDRRIPNIQTVVPKIDPVSKDMNPKILINEESQRVEEEKEYSSIRESMLNPSVKDIALEPPKPEPEIVRSSLLSAEEATLESNKEKLIRKINKTCLKRKSRVILTNELKHIQTFSLQNKRKNISSNLLELQQIARNELAEQRLCSSEVPIVVKYGNSETNIETSVKNLEENFDSASNDKTMTYKQIIDKDSTDKHILNDSGISTTKKLVLNHHAGNIANCSSVEDKMVNQVIHVTNTETDQKEKFKSSKVQQVHHKDAGSYKWKNNVSATLPALQQISKCTLVQQGLQNGEVLQENLTTPNTEDNNVEKGKCTDMDQNKKLLVQKSERYQILAQSCSNTSGINGKTSVVDALGDSSGDSQENSDVGLQILKLDMETEPKPTGATLLKIQKFKEKEPSELEIGNSEEILMENYDIEGASYRVEAEAIQKCGTRTTKLIENAASSKDKPGKKIKLTEKEFSDSESENCDGYEKNPINQIKNISTENCNDKSERDGDASCVVTTVDTNDEKVISNEPETEGFCNFKNTEDSDDRNILSETVKHISLSLCNSRYIPNENSDSSNNYSSRTNTIFVHKDYSNLKNRDSTVSTKSCTVPDTFIHDSKELDDIVQLPNDEIAEEEQVGKDIERNDANVDEMNTLENDLSSVLLNFIKEIEPKKRSTQESHPNTSNESNAKDKNEVLLHKMVAKSNRTKAQSLVDQETLNTEIIDCTSKHQEIVKHTSDEIENSEACIENGVVITVNINEGYKDMNLKDFFVYVKRCVMPTDMIPCNNLNQESKLGTNKENGYLLPVVENLRIQELESRESSDEDVHDDAYFQDSLSDEEMCINGDYTDYGNLKNLGKPKQSASTENTALVGNLHPCTIKSLNDEYKWLNLKDFSIYIERCEIPETERRGTSIASDDRAITKLQYREEVALSKNTEPCEFDSEFEGENRNRNDNIGEENSNDVSSNSKSPSNPLKKQTELISWQKQTKQALQMIQDIIDNASAQHKSKITNLKLIERNGEDVSTRFIPSSRILMTTNNVNEDYRVKIDQVSSNISESFIQPQVLEDNTGTAVTENYLVSRNGTEVDSEERHTESVELDIHEYHSAEDKTITVSETGLKYQYKEEYSETMTKIQKRRKHISERLQKIRRIKELQEKLNISKLGQIVTEQSIDELITDSILVDDDSTKAVSDEEKMQMPL